jgi:hypothetical protein
MIRRGRKEDDYLSEENINRRRSSSLVDDAPSTLYVPINKNLASFFN